jgi:Protein of unknown function (DUF3800)
VRVVVIAYPITAYLDDSGTDLPSPVACAAGFISPLAQWKKFEQEWDVARNIEGDEFKHMHMAHCVFGNPDTEFVNWSLEKKRRVLRRLRNIIKRRAVQGIGMAVTKSFYDRLVSEEIKKKVGGNFNFSVLQTMSMVGRWRKSRGIESSIEYVFDWLEPRDERRKELENLLENECERGAALDDYGLVSGGYFFRHKEDVTPLQAADMVAWLQYSAVQDVLQIKSANLLAREGYIDFQQYRKPHRWLATGFQTEDQMQEFVRQLPTSPVFAEVKELREKRKKRSR